LRITAGQELASSEEVTIPVQQEERVEEIGDIYMN
jgi:hypothetical protein